MPELRGGRGASLAVLSSSDAALARVKLNCREGGSHTSGSSGLAVWDSTPGLSAPPKLAAFWKLLLSDVRTLATAVSDSRSPGEGMGLLCQYCVCPCLASCELEGSGFHETRCRHISVPLTV